MSKKKHMTCEMVNELVRSKLKSPWSVLQMQINEYSNVLYIGKNQDIQVFLGNNQKILVADDENSLFSQSYQIDDQTLALAKDAYKKVLMKKQRNAKIHKIAGKATRPAMLLSILLMVFCPVYELYKRDTEKKEYEKAIKNKIDAYAATLPNWNDSIRLAKTEQELVRALNHREQARLQIQHFADSVRGKNAR